METKKKITIFVCGGHGPTSLIELWKAKGNEINLVIGVVDNGGNTGLMARIFQNLNQNFVPLGDLRNLWASSIINKDMESLIQSRIEHATDIDILENLNSKLLELKNLIIQICEGGTLINSYLSEEEIKLFIRNYLDGYNRLSDKEKRDLENVDGQIVHGKYVKHNIGNLFLAALAYSHEKRTGLNGYQGLIPIIKGLGLFDESVNIHLIDHVRSQLVIQNTNGQIIIEGEDKIDLTKHRLGIQTYEAYTLDFEGKRLKQTPVSPEISKLIKSSDLIIIPPGSQSNSFPWLKYYAKDLKDKLIIRIVNLTEDLSADSLANEISFLESIGVKCIYLYPRSFAVVREAIGAELYKHLRDKYATQNKKPQDLSPLEIISEIATNYGKLFNLISKEELLRRIIDIIQVNAFSTNGDSPEDLSSYTEDDPFIAEKGFRHSQKQLNLIISYILSLPPNLEINEVAGKIRDFWLDGEGLKSK